MRAGLRDVTPVNRMPDRPPARLTDSADSRTIAVLGPTNTGKTHLAIERLCAHSSGAIGFPLRLLAREVYDRVCAIKGANRVALITGEERIEPPDARWFLCTVEAMPVDADLAFVALDEAQLGADRERGHIFTDRLLHARGREETMILGSATMQPMVRALVPKAEVVSRPRFSTLRHDGAKKLSRIPPRSAIVAFSAEQVYAVAEMLRRFRGGAAVVMGALSPETRNRQVELYQSGEVDYLVATDAIGMGLNLDLGHVAFAGLSKFDGVRQRRLTTSEMAQIAGRAGRHQRDGTFGTLSGSIHHDAEFTPEEVYAIEEHRFAPLTKLFWRDSRPRHDSLAMLIDDLSCPPDDPVLAPAPEAIDLAVMRRLAEDPAVAGTVRGRASVARFHEVCTLPDFRQHGAEVHSRFVARLWEDLRRGALPTDFVAARIAELDNPAGDIDALQSRIAAVRSWSYITQRPDWVTLREEMAARARSVEARLSDALHARLTERFVNRRTSKLMRGISKDSALLPVKILTDEIHVDGELIGKLEGFRFVVDPAAHHADLKLLSAAAERHLPKLLGERALALIAEITADPKILTLKDGMICHDGVVLARLRAGRNILAPALQSDPGMSAIPQAEHDLLNAKLAEWLDKRLEILAPLAQVELASRAEESGPDLRALLIRLTEGGGVIERIGSGLDRLDPDQRTALKRLKVEIGAVDLYMPAMLRHGAQEMWQALESMRGIHRPAPPLGMTAVLSIGKGAPPHGYRRLGRQAIRVDLGERLVRQAHLRRDRADKKPFYVDERLAVGMGLTFISFEWLLRLAGFTPHLPKPLAEGALGPPTPISWRWKVPRYNAAPARTAASKAKPDAADRPRSRPHKEVTTKPDNRVVRAPKKAKSDELDDKKRRSVDAFADLSMLIR